MVKSKGDSSEEGDWKENDLENEDSEDVGFLTEDEDFDSPSKQISKKRDTPQKKSATKSPKKTKVSNVSSGKKTAEKKVKEERGTKKELTEKQGYEVILKYLNEQNKPFNAQTIFDNLHKEIKKAHVVRILAQLAQDGKIIEKEYGKSKIYFADQSQFPVVSEEEYLSMDKNISNLEEELKLLQSNVAMLKSELKDLDVALTEAELEKEISILEAETIGMQLKITQLQESTVVNPEELNTLRDEVAYAEKIWRKRRSKCREIVGVMAEGMERRDSDIIDMIGLETEEELGITLPFRR